MDVDAGAGRDSTWRRATAAAADDGDDDARGGGVGGGMEAQVVPLELYDSARAKIDANLRWLFAKAYGTGKASSVFSLSLRWRFDSCASSCVCFVAATLINFTCLFFFKFFLSKIHFLFLLQPSAF